MGKCREDWPRFRQLGDGWYESKKRDGWLAIAAGVAALPLTPLASMMVGNFVSETRAKERAEIFLQTIREMGIPEKCLPSFYEHYAKIYNYERNLALEIRKNE